MLYRDYLCYIKTIHAPLKLYMLHRDHTSVSGWHTHTLSPCGTRTVLERRAGGGCGRSHGYSGVTGSFQIHTHTSLISVPRSCGGIIRIMAGRPTGRWKANRKANRKVMRHQSSIIHHQSPITIHQSPFTNHQSPIIKHESSITNHQSSIIREAGGRLLGGLGGEAPRNVGGLWGAKPPRCSPFTLFDPWDRCGILLRMS